MKGKTANAVGWSLLWVGVLLLGFVVYQLYVVSAIARWNQASLSEDRIAAWEVAEIVAVPIASTTVPEVEDDPTFPEIAPSVTTTPLPEVPSLLLEPEPEPGEPFGLIRIAGVEELQNGWNVVEGVTREDLKVGVGHMPKTAYPGQPGNAVISGHRTTYGQPFFNLDTLNFGDAIEVQTATGVHTYSVREVFIVDPSEVWVTHPRDGGWLTLTTCNPKYSADERLIVLAELTSSPNLEAVQASF